MTPVLIMAGGRGLRLHPLTETRPKPLLNVGGKPILEQIIDGFVRQGFRKFWLAVNYKADLIEDYFGDGTARSIKIRYLRETRALGTGGALNLLPKLDVPLIVSNADVLTRLNYGQLMESHARSMKLATVCLALHQYQVPYGVAEFDDDRFVGLKEKPIQDVMVNAGIYVLDPKALERAPKGRFDMPELLDKLAVLDNLAAYPIQDYWVDVGRFEDYARANAEWTA